jgi:hypothetical protein
MRFPMPAAGTRATTCIILESFPGGNMPDHPQLVSIRQLRMRNYWFSIRKRVFFRPGQEIKGLRGGVHRYAAQVTPLIDIARAKKDRFRMKTN